MELNPDSTDSLIEVMDQVDEVYDSLTKSQAIYLFILTMQKLKFIDEFKSKYNESSFTKGEPYCMLDLINLIDMDFGDLVTAMDDLQSGATDDIIELDSKNIDVESMDDTKAFFFCIRMGQKIDFLNISSQNLSNTNVSVVESAVSPNMKENQINENTEEKSEQEQKQQTQQPQQKQQQSQSQQKKGSLSQEDVKKLQDDIQQIKSQIDNLRQVLNQQPVLQQEKVDQVTELLDKFLNNEEQKQCILNIKDNVQQLQQQLQIIKQSNIGQFKQKLQQIIKLNQQNISHNSIQPVVYQQTLLDRQQYNQRKLSMMKKCMGEQVFIPSVHSIQKQKTISKLQKMKRQITEIKLTKTVIENVALKRISNLDKVYQQCLNAIYTHLEKKLQKNQFSNIQYQEIYNKTLSSQEQRLQQVTDLYRKLITTIVDDQEQLEVLSNEYVIVNKVLQKVFDLGEILSQDLDINTQSSISEINQVDLQQPRPQTDEFSNSVEE